jgi:hypothetical protein
MSSRYKPKSCNIALSTLLAHASPLEALDTVKVPYNGSRKKPWEADGDYQASRESPAIGSAGERIGAKLETYDFWPVLFAALQMEHRPGDPREAETFGNRRSLRTFRVCLVRKFAAVAGRTSVVSLTSWSIKAGRCALL